MGCYVNGAKIVVCPAEASVRVGVFLIEEDLWNCLIKFLKALFD